MTTPSPRVCGKPRGISKINAAKTHCDHGHLFDQQNTYLYLNYRGYRFRQCRQCKRDRKNTLKGNTPWPNAEPR